MYQTKKSYLRLRNQTKAVAEAMMDLLRKETISWWSGAEMTLRSSQTIIFKKSAMNKLTIRIKLSLRKISSPKTTTLKMF